MAAVFETSNANKNKQAMIIRITIVIARKRAIMAIKIMNN